MLRLSKKTWLALEAVVDVAINARPDPVQSKEITKRQGIPQRYLEQVMQQLVHAGILKGVRGPAAAIRWRASGGASRLARWCAWLARWKRPTSRRAAGRPNLASA